MAKLPEASDFDPTSIPGSKSNTDGLIGNGIGAVLVACLWLALYVTAIVHSLMSGRNSTATEKVEAIAQPAIATAKSAPD
jgi:hypothetical protein